MSDEPSVPCESRPTSFELSTWADAPARATLQLIAASVAQMAGFEVAVISAVQDDTLVSVAIEGDEDVRDALSGMRTPLDVIHADLAVAEDWGRFQYVHHAHSTGDDEFRWVPDLEPGDEPDAWHPMDALMAPLRSEDGELVGLLSIDLPLSRRRPAPSEVALLGRYAAQAEQALLNALERDALEQRLRLTEVARHVVRIAVSRTDVVAALVDECRPALLDGFRADDLTIRLYGEGSGPDAGTEPLGAVDDLLRERIREMARTCWLLQRVGVLTTGWRDDALADHDEHEDLERLLGHLGFASAMVVPIGAGPHCLGHLIMMRSDGRPPWADDERSGALEVARDIGHAVLAARTLAAEQRLVGELRALDTYKTQLLSTVSHELKNPLGTIAGHLELVADTPSLSEGTLFSVGAMERATRRLTRVVDDLLTLARLEDPDQAAVAAELDLRPVLVTALDSARLAAERDETALVLEAPAGPLPVCGDADGLERVLVNLVGNAVKYSPRRSEVRVVVAYRDHSSTRPRELEVAVVDQGIGISEDDQAHLFREFFRSTNPVALAEPGTGLGLVISARTLASFGGRIEVDSTLGAGSTFRVVLEAPPA